MPFFASSSWCVNSKNKKKWSYDSTQKVQVEWVAKFPYVEL